MHSKREMNKKPKKKKKITRKRKIFAIVKFNSLNGEGKEIKKKKPKKKINKIIFVQLRGAEKTPNFIPKANFGVDKAATSYFPFQD